VHVGGLGQKPDGIERAVHALELGGTGDGGHLAPVEQGVQVDLVAHELDPAQLRRECAVDAGRQCEMLRPDPQRGALGAGREAAGQRLAQRDHLPAGPEVAAIHVPLDHVHLGAADEARDEEVGGLLVKLLGGCDLHDVAVLHHADAVAHGHRLGLVVGDVDHRAGHAFTLEALVQVGDPHPHGGPQLGVEVRQRLVEEEHVRLLDQRAAQGHALRLAARELLGQPVEERLDLEDLGDLLDRLGGLGLRGAADAQPEGEVGAHLHMRVERVVLEHHRDATLARLECVDDAVTDADLAGGDLLEPGDHPQRGGLGAARGPHQHHELAFLDIEVDPVHRLEGTAIDLFEISQLKPCHYPLIPPAEMPSMKYFCAMKNTASAGVMVSTDMARMRFHSKASVVSMESFRARLTGYLSTELI